MTGELKKRAAIYLRVSTESQTGRDGDPEGYSISAQREATIRKAKELGAEVVAEYSDPGVSGRTDKRDGLQALLERIRTVGDIFYVIVWKLSRLSRSPLLDATLELELLEHDVQLVSVTENIDSSTPSGKLLKRILGTINAYEIDNLAQGVKAGLARKVKTGGTPTQAPLGYLNVRKIVDGNEVRTVEIDPERAPIIQWAFRAYATGTYSITSLLRAVTERGLRTRATKKRPSRPLARSAFAKMLTNPYYTGVVPYQGIENPGRHEPLITRELFDRVQEVLKANQNGEKVQRHYHYLKGSIFCTRCLSRYSLTYSQGNGGIYPYFFCLGRASGNGCDQPYLQVDQVEEDIASFYGHLEIEPEVAEKLRSGFRAQLREDRKRLIAEGVRQAKRLEELQKQRHKLLDLHYQDIIATDLFAEEQKRITAEMSAAKGAIEEANQEWEEIEMANNILFDLSQRWEKIYRSADEPLKRRINRSLFGKILVDEERPVEGELIDPPSVDRMEPYFDRARKEIPAVVGAQSSDPLKAGNPALVSVGPGSNIVTLVAGRGFEPL